MIHKVYTDKINGLKEKEASLKTASNAYVAGKLLFFSLFLIASYFAFRNTGFGSVAWAVCFLVVYLILYVQDNQCRKKINLLVRIQTVCKNEIACLEGDFSPFDKGEKYIDYHHAYSYDFDLFGTNSLFHRINRTVTAMGSDNLAQRLTCPNQDKEGIINNREAIAELSNLFDWRIKFLTHPYISNDPDALSQLMAGNKRGNYLIKSFLPYLMVALTVVAFLLGMAGVLSWNYFGSAFFVQLFISILFSKASMKTNLKIEKLHKEYRVYQHILNEIYEQEFKSNTLKGLKETLFGKEKDSIQAFQRLSEILKLFDLRCSDIMYILLNGAFLFDILLMKRFAKWNSTYLSCITPWMQCIAELDALVSLATYTFNHPNNVQAEVLSDEEDDVIQAVDVYHPFLPYEKAVPNSFTLKKGNVSIVTGANMAGKSTFLRTIGITYVLASCGVPVCAKSFRFSIVTLFSSMRTTDDLSNDISYFHAELLRLEQLIRHVKSHHFTLIILDEILKGTNSEDKLKGSVMFLQELVRYRIAALVATHDLELAKLEGLDGTRYTNYCFEIELSDPIVYSYKISRGIAHNLNASYLLSNMLRKLN